MGDYARAEPLWQRAVAIRQRLFGPDHLETAQSLNNLAVLFMQRGAELPDKGDNTYEPVQEVLAGITRTFTEGVKEKAPGGIGVTQGGGGAGALVIRSRVAFILPGSAAARHFGGLAGKFAAASRVGLSGEVIDGKTKKVLFRFKQKRSSSMGGGIFGGDYVKLLNQSAKEVGNDVSNALRGL